MSDARHRLGHLNTYLVSSWCRFVEETVTERHSLGGSVSLVRPLLRPHPASWSPPLCSVLAVKVKLSQFPTSAAMSANCCHDSYQPWWTVIPLERKPKKTLPEVVFGYSVVS